MTIRLSTALAVFAAAAAVSAQDHQPTESQTAKDVPQAKQTELGLYVTARGAYEMWQAHPERVKILDVRTPEEYVFVGHAAMARNIPLAFFVHQWDAARSAPRMRPNPDFLEQVKRFYQPDDTILITCRSGGRSKRAVDALAQAGFRNVYNILDGMEGDVVKDPDSLFDGKHMKNGWKNSGAPWTYQLDPALMYLDPEAK
jgi:rhodanese-related sulfurtransferase